MDPERIKIMTKLAIMEQREGEEMMKICSYRRLDYMLTEMFRAFVAGSVCYILVLVLWFCYLWDTLNAFTADLDYLQFFRNIGKYYLISVLIYMGICALVAFFRHRKGMALRKTYRNYLKRLRASYRAERRAVSTRAAKTGAAGHRR